MKGFLDFILERSKNDPMPEVYKNNKLVYFVIGAPASGKNYYMENEILRKNKKFNVIDPDEKSNLLTKHLNKVKSSFKDRVSYTEYVNILNGRIETYPSIKGLTKELEKQFEISLHEGTNIIYNSTGNNREMISYLIDKCNEFGYEIVFLHVMGKNLDWQIHQSNLRAAFTGRPVDDDYIKYSYKNTHKLIKYYSNLNIDSYYLIWNRGLGEKPKWYKYENDQLKRRAGSIYKPIRESLKTNKRILHAFDMDDTLIDSPQFSDFLRNGIPNVNTEMGKVIKNELSKYGLSMDDATVEDKRVTVDSFKAPQDWEINSNGRSIMPKPSEFYKSKESLGTSPNPRIKKIFDESDNNCIITGRREEMRSLIEGYLYDMDVYPNKGIYMCPDNIIESYDIAVWKSNVISNLLEIYDEVHFYEDKRMWTNTVRDENPSLKLTVYLVRDGRIIKKL